MALVKLDATTSTNDFLKELAADPATENYTVVTAESQSAGRGQMGATWSSEEGKNLMMSVLIKDVLNNANQLFGLNVAVALAVVEALEKHDIPDLRIKWPNDIMSGNKKVGGILIENSFKSDGAIVSIVGLGLNVNQADFTALPKAGSLYTITNRLLDKELIRDQIVDRIIRNANFLCEHSEILWETYHAQLFKANVPMPFEDAEGKRFMGIIKNVTRDGKLELLLDDDSIKTFAVKQVQMLY
jgi:BirA family transcriptional regulator, biotin operon repressor / biotin---[acetyl-CoA-carboxylase] ligase